jgi:glycosyltransferase involved in cell wall biosynthesis
MTDRTSLVVASPYGPAAPSTRVRLYEWLAHLGLSAERLEYAGLARNGLASVVRRPLAAVRAELTTRRAARSVSEATLLLSREASPFSRGGLEADLLTGARRGVYDLDDALFADRDGWRRVLAKEPKCRRSLEAADHVIVGNDYLAEYASALTDDLTVIPTCVEPSAYRPTSTYEISDQPTLVWLGSPSTEPYLEEIATALAEVHRLRGARVVLISGPRPQGSPEFADFVRRVPWSPEGVADALAQADVALGPLPDDAYTRGKCAYKILQYAATGLPIVASPVGANSTAIARLGGLAATTHDEWVEALTSVLDSSAAARREQGSAALSGVREHYSFDVWADAWRKAVGL